MSIRGKKGRMMLCSILIIMMFTVFNPNVNFQISVVHEGDWETVEYINGMDDLQTGEPIIIEGELVSQEFQLASSETNYVDAEQSHLYGDTSSTPPDGMGIDSVASSGLEEHNFVSTSYTTKTSYTGGSLPAGWSNTDWIFGASYTSIMGIAETGGNFYTNTHDMSSYDGVRVKFAWRNDGSRTTELGDLECNSYEGGNNVWFESPVGNQGSFTNELRDSSWHSTGWKVTFTASGLDGDIETWEGFRVDNIYLQGKTDSTYYRFEAVYRFDNVDYAYGTERLYIDYDATTSQEGLQYYGGTTTDPSSYIGGTSGVEPDTYFDVHDELTGTPFYVKIKDLTRTDGDQDTWVIDRLYLSLSNEGPVNSQDAVCTNIDASNRTYAYKKEYIFTSNVTDGDGYADIDYVKLSCVDGVTVVWTIRYTESGDVFAEVINGTYIELNTGSCSVSKVGNVIDITWVLEITWLHPTGNPDGHNLDLKQEVADSKDADVDVYDVDYTYCCQLGNHDEGFSDDAGSNNRGDINEVIHFEGHAHYYDGFDGGSSVEHPSNGAVKWWVSTGEVAGSPWSTTTTGANGAFDVTCAADDVFGQDLYTMKATAIGDVFGGTNLFYDTSPSANYVADALIITITGPTDNRQNLNANASGIVVSAVYQYPDSSQVFNGVLTLNNTDYNGDGTVVRWGYTVSSASGDAHGVTAIFTNDDTYMIWDRIYAVSLSYGGDTRINAGTSVNFDYTLHYDYDETDVTDGTITINSQSFTHQGSGVWRYTTSNGGNVGDITFDSIVASGNTYGITTTTTNGNDVTLIWDRIQVQGYAITTPSGDNRNNIGTVYYLIVYIWYDFDNTQLADGTVTINGIQGIYDAGIGWRFNDTSAIIHTVTFNNVQATGNTYGITVEDQNGKSQQIIWDQLIILGYSSNSTDNHDNINDGVSITVWVQYDYDDTNVTDGFLTINGEYFANDGNGNFTAIFSNATASSATWNSVVQGGTNTHGISSVNQNGKSLTFKWDSLTIIMGDPTDQRQNLNANASGIVFSAVYYLGGTYDGTLNLNASDFNGDGTVVRWGWKVDSANGDDTYGITVISDASDETYMIWDAIGINMWISDGRDNIDDTIIVYAWLTYIYDRTNVTDGTVLLNGTGMSYALSIWSLGRSQSTAGLWAYNITSISGNTYGITVVGSCDFDGDGDYVTSTYELPLNDFTISLWFKTNDVTIPAQRLIHVQYSRFSIHLSGDDLYAQFYNGTSYYSYQANVIENDIWYHVLLVKSSTTGFKCYLNGVVLTATSAETLNVNYVTQDISIGAGEGAADSFSNYLNGSIDNVRIYNRTLGAVERYELYQERYSNDTGLVFHVNMASYDVADNVWYDLSGGSNDGTIVNVVVNAITDDYLYVRPIWDSLTVTITNPTDQRININANASGMHISAIWDYDSVSYDGTLTLNDTTYDHGTVGIYYYTVTVGNGDGTYGITVVSSSDSVYCIFDRIKILTTSATSNFIEKGVESTTVNVTAELEYDSHSLGSGDTLYMNDTSMTWDTDHYYITFGPYDVFGSWILFVNSTGANEVNYGITVVWLNGQDDTIGTDRIKVLSYAISDARDNVDDYIWVNVTIEYESDNTDVVDGTIVINGYSFTYLEGGIWRHNRTESVVVGITFDTLVASSNARGIAVVNQNGQSQLAIWDRILIVTTVSTDGRIDYGTTTTINVTATLEYEAHTLGSGDTLYMNGTSMIWDIDHYYITTGAYNIVDIINYFVNSTSANEDTYGINVINLDGNSANVIWDRILILTTLSTDGRIDYGTSTTITVTATLEYEAHSLGSGDTLYMNGTSMTWDTDHFYITTGSYNIIDLINYFVNSTSANENTYGITVINLDGNSANVIWDRVQVAMAVNMTWTIINYYVNVSYTGTYEYGGDWSGYATIANTSLTTGDAVHYEEIVFSSVLNKTFYATAIEDAGGYGLTILISTTTVWCVWDNMTADAMYGAEVDEYSKTFVILFGPLSWQYNGSGIGADWRCYNIRNGTALTSSITLSDSYLEPLSQEVPIPTDWDVILYSNNATKTINGRSYNFQWFSVVQTVVILQNIMEENTEILDTSIVISGTTNVDFTWTVYNEGVVSGETGTVSNASDWRISFNMIMTYGNHSYAIYFDAGVSGSRWLNSTYFFNFDVNIDPPEVRGDSVEVRGVINLACNYYVYHEGVYSDETGSLTPETFSFFFTKKTTIGLHNYSLYFNVSLTVSIWKNGSYEVPIDYSYCSVILYGPDGVGIDLILFKIYVNDVEYTGSSITFYGRTDITHNITILNYFDEIIGTDNNVMPDDRVIHVEVSVYAFKIYNQMDDEFIYFSMTSSGGATWNEHIAPREVVKFYLYGGNTYTYTFTALSGPYSGTHIGTVSVSGDTGMIIDGFDLVQIYDGIGRIGGGGSVTIEDMTIALNAAQGGILNQVQFYTWINVIMLFVGLYAIPFIKSKGRIKPVETEIVIEETFNRYEKVEKPKKRGEPFKKKDKRIKPKKKKPAYEQKQEDMEQIIKRNKEKEDAIWNLMRGEK